MPRGGIGIVVASVLVTWLFAAAQAEPLALRLDATLTCPDAAQVERALARQDLRGAPSWIVSLEGASDGSVSVTLRQQDGAILLERRLPAGDCTALAEAVALLVQRRVEGIGWAGELPDAERPAASTPLPAPPPTTRSPPRVRPTRRPGADLALAADAGVVIAGGLEDQPAAPGPAVTMTLSWRWLALSLAGAWISRSDVGVAGGTLAIDEAQVALEAAFVLRAPRFELRLGPRLAVAIVHAETNGLPRVADQTRGSVRAGPVVSVAVPVLPWAYVRVGLGVMGLASGWDFDVEGAGVVARQSAWALEGGAALGARLPL